MLKGNPFKLSQLDRKLKLKLISRGLGMLAIIVDIVGSLSLLKVKASDISDVNTNRVPRD